MSDTIATRPRGSRLGLVLFLLLLTLGVWEVVGRVTPLVKITPLRFAQAAWSVASGHGASPLGGPGPEDMDKLAYRPLPYVNFGLKENWERKEQFRDGVPLKKTTNNLGFRGRDIVIPKPAGCTRIVCLGGSTTYGDGTDDDHTYPVLLEKALRAARPGKDIEVINAGVLSYTTAESLPNLAFRCLDFQPDIIVLYEGINDVRPRRYANFDNGYFHYRKVWDGSASGFEAGPKGTDMEGGINCFIQRLRPADNGDEAENQARAGTTAFRNNLTSIAGIAAAHGIKVVMVSNVSDPGRYDLDPALVAGIVENNGVVKDVAARQSALFIDMAAAYQGKDQFTDLIHMNDEGSLQMARLIADGMLKGTL